MGSASFRLDTDGVYRVTAFEQFPWLRHGFGTRLSPAWPEELPFASLKQVHSAIVVPASSPGLAGEGDALIGNTPGLMLSVRTADCVPILLLDPEHRAVAAVHAGWRGTAQRIVWRAISELASHFGTSSGEIYAAIGPAVGPCCYEVGPEVARQFASWHSELLRADGPVKIDLVEMNRRQLLDAAVGAERIFSCGLCSSCNPAEFHSFRRDKESAGRMVAAIGFID